MNKLNFQFTNWLKDLPDKVVDVIIDNTANHLKGAFLGDVLGHHMNKRDIGGLFMFSAAPHYDIIEWYEVQKGNLDSFYKAYPELKPDDKSKPTIDTTWVSGPYKGQIKGFPEEVVNRMLYEQQLKGNKKNIIVFERNKGQNKEGGGFTWFNTEDDRKKPNFWYDVIILEKFDLFFEHYPTTKPPFEPTEEKEDPRPYSEYCKEDDLFQVIKENGYFTLFEYVLYKRGDIECNWYYHLNKSDNWAISDEKIKLIAHKGTPEYNSKLRELGYDPETLEPLKGKSTEPVIKHENNPDIIDGVDTSVEGWYIPKLHKDNYNLKKKRAEQVIEILKQRGFDKTNYHYELMYDNGDYRNIVKSYQRELKSNINYSYIDCGDGFLWWSEYDIIHKGTEEYLASLEEKPYVSDTPKEKISNVIFKNPCVEIPLEPNNKFESVKPLTEIKPVMTLFNF